MAAQAKRIVVAYPTHPAFLGVYLLLGFVLSLILIRLPSLVADISRAPLSPALAILVTVLIDLSPLLSFVNLVVKTLRTGTMRTVVEIDYVEFFGIPVPIPRLSLREVETFLAVNLGGAVVPIVASVLFAYMMWLSPFSLRFATSTVVSLALTAVVTYLVARPVPGVGIAVPAFVPPVIAALSSIMFNGFGAVAAVAAYIAGSVGSLLGADVFRLLRSYRELNAPMLSIGGAGVFDGIYISGILAFLLAL